MSPAFGSLVTVALGLTALGCNPSSDLSLEGLECDGEGRCAAGYRCEGRLCVAEGTFDAGEPSPALDPPGPSSPSNGGESQGEPSVEPVEEPAVGVEPAPAEPTPPTEPVEPTMEPSVEPTTEPGVTPAGCGPLPPSDDLAPCPPECTSCVGGGCVIECGTGASSCTGETLVCPAGLRCEVQCVGTRACAETTLDGSSTNSLSVACSGNAACQELLLQCPANGPCSVDCQASKDVCLGSIVQCGGGACEASCVDSAQGTPNLECNDACVCSGC